MSAPRHTDGHSLPGHSDGATRSVERFHAVIVGGGPVGLTTSIMLSRAGVRSLLVERHPATAIHPKSRGVNARTMEVFDQIGVGAAVVAAGLDPASNGFFFRGPSLVAEQYTRFGGGGRSDDLRALSPTTWMVIAQDVLEPILLAQARELVPAEVRFGHELRSLTAGRDGVEAVVLDRSTGRESLIESDYVIGADGAESLVRESAGLTLKGHGPLTRNVSILFHADLEAVVADRRSAVYYITDDEARPGGHPISVGNPPPAGVLLTVNNVDRWLLVVRADAGATRADGSLDRARCEELIRAAAGVPDLTIDVRSVMTWSPAARVAPVYRHGRVFLAGDAAHEMTPSGAFGLNVGIQDAHNLGWKLGAVLAGWAGAGLLDTYDAERRPVGRWATEESYRQFAGESLPTPFGNWGIIFGNRYSSSAVVEETDASEPENDSGVSDAAATSYVPTGRPGGRAPHAWLGREPNRRSILERYGRDFVLVSGDDAARSWTGAARRVAVAGQIPISTASVGVDLDVEEPDPFRLLYGIEASGAVLVRPDGYVAWRSRTSSDDPDVSLRRAIAAILDRPDLAGRGPRNRSIRKHGAVSLDTASRRHRD